MSMVCVIMLDIDHRLGVLMKHAHSKRPLLLLILLCPLVVAFLLGSYAGNRIQYDIVQSDMEPFLAYYDDSRGASKESVDQHLSFAFSDPQRQYSLTHLLVIAEADVHRPFLSEYLFRNAIHVLDGDELYAFLYSTLDRALDLDLAQNSEVDDMYSRFFDARASYHFSLSEERALIECLTAMEDAQDKYAGTWGTLLSWLRAELELAACDALPQQVQLKA